MMKLKIPHKKKAMNENTISETKAFFTFKTQTGKPKNNCYKKERPKKKRKDRAAKERTKDISCVIFGKNFRYLKSAYFSKKTKQFRPKLEARILPSVFVF